MTTSTPRARPRLFHDSKVWPLYVPRRNGGAHEATDGEDVLCRCLLSLQKAVMLDLAYMAGSRV